MKEINTDDQQTVYVDDEDYCYITNCYDIKVNYDGYVQCMVKKKYKRMGLFSMPLHKILMNPNRMGRCVVVDHVDGNKLDNQKSNLRVCSHQQNMQNRKVHDGYANKKKASQYKGVYYDHGWKAQMGKDAGKLYIGSYDSEITAANAYNHKAKELFGEFSRLNNVEYMSKEDVESRNVANKKTSKYRGVSLVDSKWLVQIYHKGKNIIIGKYDDEIRGAREYDKKAIELKGDRARLNFRTK